MKKRFKNINDEYKFIEIKENSITVLTAHNGFGKTTLHDKFKKKIGDSYHISKSLEPKAYFNDDWSYLLNKNFFHNSYHQFDSNMIFYNKLLNNLDNNKSRHIFQELLLDFSKKINKIDNKYYMETSYNATKNKKYNHFIDEYIFDKIDNNFFEKYIDILEIISEGIDNSNGDKISVEWKLEDYLEDDGIYEIELSIDDDDVSIGEEHVISEQVNELKNNVMELMEDLYENHYDEYILLKRLDIWKYNFNNWDNFWIPISASFLDIYFPGLKHIHKILQQINKNAVKVSMKEYHKFCKYIKETPIRDPSFFSKKRTIFINR